MRRRKYRHISQIKPIDIEQLRNFQNKYHLVDLGQMERVTFIHDDGKISSYEKVPVHGNTKSHIFNLDFSKYKNSKLLRHKNSTSSLNSLDTASKKGVRIERANDLLKTLNTLNTKERSSSEPPTLARSNEIRTRINELVGTVDSHDYISMLTNRNLPSLQNSKAYNLQANSSSNDREIPNNKANKKKAKSTHNNHVKNKVNVTSFWFVLNFLSIRS